MLTDEIGSALKHFLKMRTWSRRVISVAVTLLVLLEGVYVVVGVGAERSEIMNQSFCELRVLASDQIVIVEDFHLQAFHVD